MADAGLDAVYASDLGRAHATAQTLAGALGLAVRPEPGLRERHFGVFEGMTFDEVALRWPDQSLRWRQRDPDFAATGGETLRGFYARVVEAASRLAAAHPGQLIALVAHGGVLDCLYRAATRLALDAPRTWQIANASVNRLLYSASGFTLVGWSDNTHLTSDALDEETAA